MSGLCINLTGMTMGFFSLLHLATDAEMQSFLVTNFVHIQCSDVVWIPGKPAGKYCIRKRIKGGIQMKGI